jgi:hypothetical protein
VGERQDPNNIQRREVPEEALQALAREVAREAGLAQDPNDTALLQNDKARAEARRIIAGLVERIPAIEAPAEAPEASEAAEETQGRGEPHSATGEAQEGVQRRGFWRRLFGGWPKHRFALNESEELAVWAVVAALVLSTAISLFVMFGLPYDFLTSCLVAVVLYLVLFPLTLILAAVLIHLVAG